MDRIYRIKTPNRNFVFILSILSIHVKKDRRHAQPSAAPLAKKYPRARKKCFPSRLANIAENWIHDDTAHE